MFLFPDYIIFVNSSTGINQYVERLECFSSRKIILIVSIPNFKEKFLGNIAMSGQFFGRCAALVEEVLTCAHAPQTYKKVG